MKLSIIKRSTIIFILIINVSCKQQQKRALQKSHEKPRIEKLLEKFLLKETTDDISEIVGFLVMIYNNYLYECISVILYDEKTYEYFRVLENVFKKVNATFIHGWVSSYTTDVRIKFEVNTNEAYCINYVVFINDVFNAKNILGKQNINKVVLVTKSSQWKVNEFLLSETSRNLINLLIVGPSNSRYFEGIAPYYILHTHELFVDGLGSSAPKILTSWRNGSLTRPEVKLFSPKMHSGFSGHRFITSVAHQPPFVINRGLNENDDILWDGIEIKLLRTLAELYNYTLDIKPAKDDPYKSPADKVIDNVNDGTVNVGLSGIYLTTDRLEKLDVSYPHSYDCAAFISLTSTALPRYRAIMGPFHWTVWLALTITYLFAIFPLAFADKHTLKHLLTNPEEIENMFWYVFGTFTNCFIFGNDTWTKSSKVTPRLLIGFYWIFTIIITACYTGSIIAFITVPIFPSTVDTVQQLLSGGYRIGTLDKGGWQFWFKNSTDKPTQQLLKNIELLSKVESGLENITTAFFWPYAFLGSRAQLDYIVQTNFSTTKKKSLFHISSECFVPFGISAVFGKYSIYKDIIDKGISYLSQSGFVIKFEHDIRWDMMRSPTGKLLQASGSRTLKLVSLDDRSLAFADTQGTFLLLFGGFLGGIFSLIFEKLGGSFKCYKKKKLNTASSISSNPRSHNELTPREKLDSIQYNHNEFAVPYNTQENLNINEAYGNIYQYTSSNIEDTKERNLSKNYNFDKLFGEENLNSQHLIVGKSS